ncbi:MAG TPA: transglutaminase family protein [Steroidobacteraceae bacterium]|nr:transglutaminase family protein [Steroidobacteraceae bacterium]
MAILHVRHTTRYEYRVPVELGEHRLMMRPRDSHDLRLIDTHLVIEPPTSSLRWIHDVFGNSIALASFGTAAQSLQFTSEFRAEHFPAAPQQLALESYAERFPFSYSAQESEDLGRTKERHYADPEHEIDRWAQAQLQSVAEGRTLETLAAMTSSIKQQFRYVPRDAPGTQTPLETLKGGSGSCRDFALFMMEAARSLGLAARFVSGYLYDEKLVGARGGLVGSGATHAWLQVFLPGAGWVEYDPTNALIGGRNLIRVAVARDPSQAQPLTGSFTGPTDAFIAMKVSVEVAAE